MNTADHTSSTIQIPENGFYYHNKHDPAGPINQYAYEVIGVAKDTEDEHLSVLYRPLYDSAWMPPATYQSRPLEMFVGTITKDGKTIDRFQKITDPDTLQKLHEIRIKMF